MRGVALLPSGQVLIRDELTGLKPRAEVRWGMITSGSPDGAGSKKLRLRHGDARLKLEVLQPESTAWELVDTAKPRNPWDSPNKGTQMVAFQTPAPASGTLTLVVLATPSGHEQPGIKGFVSRQLSEWAVP